MSDTAPRPEQRPAPSPTSPTAFPAPPPGADEPWRPVQPADLTGLLQPHGDPTRPVRPGEAVGRVLDGTAFPPPGDTPGPLDIDQTTGELMARELGVLERVDRAAGAPPALVLRPLLSVSRDGLVVLADVHATDHHNRPLDPDAYHAAAARLGIAAGPDNSPLDADALRTALRDAARMGPRTGVVLARGTPPVHGRDGWLEFLPDASSTCPPGQDEGHVACSDRWPHFTVAPGHSVARLRPPTPGTPGVDVFGAHVAPRPGAVLELAPGPGIRLQKEDGGATLFVATAPGLVDVAWGEVTITPLTVIDGDVDLASGDISLPNGSAHVRGTVRSGVTLTVQRHVLVDEAVENARVRCGGDLMVRGGIVMGRAGREAVGSVAAATGSSSGEPYTGTRTASPRDGSGASVDAGVEAGGNVVAAHMAFALVTADGDVVAPTGVMASRITAGGQFLAPGRGVVIGSAIRAGTGIDIGEAGSVAETPTRLMVQPDTSRLNALLRESDGLAARMTRISAELPPGPDMAVLLQTPEEDRTLVEALLRLRAELDARQQELGQDIALERKRYQTDLATSSIIIRRRTHGGVRVQFGGRGYDAIPAETGVQYVWRAATRRVAVVAAPTAPVGRLHAPHSVRVGDSSGNDAPASDAPSSDKPAPPPDR